MDKDSQLMTKVFNHLREMEILYGWLNIDSNRKSFMYDKATDDIMSLFYESSIDLYLESLSLDEKQKRGILG